MEIKKETIICKDEFSRSCRKTPFTYVAYKFKYSEDKELIETFRANAQQLAHDVNRGAANDSMAQRSESRIYANCLGGVISEYCWMHYLNQKKETVKTTRFESAANQIDLEIISNGKKIEVRSSFPRNGIKFAVCHPLYQFDILGPYHNNYKPGEVQKEYYVRTLFHMNSPLDIIDKIMTDEFIVYLTGGATWNMMMTPGIYKVKSLEPEGFYVESTSNYRVVPYQYALDTEEMYALITNEN